MRQLAIAIFWALCGAVCSASAAEPAPYVEQPLVEAAKTGDIATIQSLLKSGTPVNSVDENQCTALNWAAYFGHLEIVKTLIEKGATIDSRCNKAHWTPLMNASAMGHLEIAALLLDRGADINARSTDGGYTPLMYASKKKMKYVVALLLDRGAAINDRSDEGMTALDFTEDPDIVAALKAHGAVEGK